MRRRRRPRSRLPEKVSAGYGPLARVHGELVDEAVLGRPVRAAVHELVLDEEDGAVVVDRRATSIPPMSWHSLGATTTMPGTPMRSFSSDWLCVGP